jgi:hypothetical protein
MLLLLAAAIAASPPRQSLSEPTRELVQARATVRIVSGARLNWDQGAKGDQPTARMTMIRTAQGEQQARLIEFE